MTETTDETKRALTRRQTLGLAGAAGATYLTAKATLGLRGPGRVPDPVDPDVAEAASCTLAPEVTQGPYWVDEGLNRSNVVGGQAGVPLTLTLNILSITDDCAPYQGAYVDIWHCNASGLYSDEAVEGTSGQTYLRGYQVSGSDGSVTFTTIYPGWYPGRTIHIHVRIRTFSGGSTTFNYTTQLFFDESVNSAVIATSPYNTRGSSKDTSNASDSVYKEEVNKGNVLLVPLSGNTGSGYSGSATISLSGLPSSGSSGSVDATLRRARFQHHRGHRSLRLKIECEEKVAAYARLMRRGKVIAKKRIDSLAAGGTRTLAVPIGEGVSAGKATLALTLRDVAGNTKDVTRSVNVPDRP